MDSTLTLVSPSRIRLDFSHNRFTSAILSVSGIPVYQISTPDRAGQRTEVKDVNTKEVVIVIKRRDLLPDMIQFRDGKSEQLKKWLRRNEARDGSWSFAFDTSTGTYEWKSHPEYRIALYHINNPISPVAHLLNDQETPSIIMEAGTESFRDQILASMLVAERELKGIQDMRSPDLQASVWEMGMAPDLSTMIIRGGISKIMEATKRKDK